MDNVLELFKTQPSSRMNCTDSINIDSLTFTEFKIGFCFYII